MDNMGENQSSILKGCPECDHGWIWVKGSDGIDRVKACKCQEVEKSKIRLHNSGISEEFQKKGFLDYETGDNKTLTMAKAKSIDYFTNFIEREHQRRNSILLSGQPGSGKTHLLMAIGNNLMSKKNVGVLYMPYRESITKIKQVVTDEFNYARVINPYKTARVLMIDDLFKGSIKEADMNAMFEIINFRYLNDAPMIISTEKTMAQLIDIDEATGSRIAEMCHDHTIQFTGKELNYRMKG